MNLDHRINASPQLLARIVGGLYLIIIAGGVFDEAFVRGRIIVSADAAATAANILQMEGLWRFSAALEVFMLTCSVGMAWIMWILLRPVSRDLAVLAAFFNLLAIGIEAANELKLQEALLPLGNAKYLAAFSPEQLHALTRLTLRSYAHGFGIALIFFAGFCLVVGYLIFRSRYLPKALGVLMAIAGICYLVNCYAYIAAPQLADLLFPFILLGPLIGESALCLWLLVKGVDLAEWDRATATP